MQLKVLKSQGCALRKIDRNQVFGICEIRVTHISWSSKSQRKGARGHPALLNGAIRVEAVHVMNLSLYRAKKGQKLHFYVHLYHY